MHVSGEDGVWGRVIRGSIWWFVRVHAVLGRGKRQKSLLLVRSQTKVAESGVLAL